MAIATREDFTVTETVEVKVEDGIVLKLSNDEAGAVNYALSVVPFAEERGLDTFATPGEKELMQQVKSALASARAGR